MPEAKQTEGGKGQGQGQVGAPPEAVDREGFFRLGTIKDVVSIAQSVVTIIAILVAGVWFLLRGETLPRANISHVVSHRQLNDQWTWVNVGITIENVGKRPLALESGTIRIQQILPLDPLITKSFEEGKSPVSPEEFKVAWPELDSFEPKLDVHIEPGESHRSTYDFIIPANIKTVKIYSAFTNPEKPGLCWVESTIYEVKDQGGRK